MVNLKKIFAGVAIVLLILVCHGNVVGANTFGRKDIKGWIQEIAERKGIHPDLLEAIVDVESCYCPYAICVNNKGKPKAYFPDTYEEAIQLIEKLEERGKNFDVGLAQINIRTIKRLGYQAEDLLEPYKNLEVAAGILKRLIARYGLTWKAVYRYNGSKSYAIKIYKVLVRGNP